MSTLKIWIEHGGAFHKFEHMVPNSCAFMSQIRYPVDLFVLLQPYADVLGLGEDWDMDNRELYVYSMTSCKSSSSSDDDVLQKIEQRFVGACLGEDEGRIMKLDGLSKSLLYKTLLKMAESGWRDVIFIKDVIKRDEERDLWRVMEDISCLSLDESDG